VEYVKLYTALLTHPKAQGLSDRAWRTLTLAWLYAGEHETGGHVPDAARPFIRSTPKAVAELEERGWWARNGTGWQLNDWDEHQETAEEIRQRRAVARDRQRRRRAKLREGDA